MVDGPNLYRAYFAPNSVDPSGLADAELTYPPSFQPENQYDVEWNTMPGASGFDERIGMKDIEINPDFKGDQSQVWNDVIHEHVGGRIYEHTGYRDLVGLRAQPSQAFSNLSVLTMSGSTGAGCNAATHEYDQSAAGTVYGTKQFRAFRDFFDACCCGKDNVVGKSIYTSLSLQSTTWRRNRRIVRFWWRLDCVAPGEVSGRFDSRFFKVGTRRKYEYVHAPIPGDGKSHDGHSVYAPSWWPLYLSPTNNDATTIQQTP